MEFESKNIRQSDLPKLNPPEDIEVVQSPEMRKNLPLLARHVGTDGLHYYCEGGKSDYDWIDKAAIRYMKDASKVTGVKSRFKNVSYKELGEPNPSLVDREYIMPGFRNKSDRFKAFIRTNYFEHPKRRVRKAFMGGVIALLASTGARGTVYGTEMVVNNTGYSISVGAGNTHQQVTGGETKTFGLFDRGVSIAKRDGKEEGWEIRGFAGAPKAPDTKK